MVRASSRPAAVAVLDVGKTNVKLLAIAPHGAMLSSRQAPNAVRSGEPYPSCDTEHLWRWLMAALADLGESFAITAIVPTSYGSTAALVNAAELVLPILDYEADPPAAIAAAYAEVAPWFEECCCPINPAGLTLGRQLFWQSRMFAEDFARARWILPFAQYWAWGLCGVPASRSDVARGADPALESRASAISRAWSRVRAGSTNCRHCAMPGTSSGPLQFDVADKTGLPIETPVAVRHSRQQRQSRPLSRGRPRGLHADLDRHLADHLQPEPAAGPAAPVARHRVQHRPPRTSGSLRPVHGRARICPDRRVRRPRRARHGGRRRGSDRARYHGAAVLLEQWRALSRHRRQGADRRSGAGLCPRARRRWPTSTSP